MGKKVLINFILMLILGVIFFNFVQCTEKVGEGFDYEQIPNGDPVSNRLKAPFQKIMATSMLILQIASVAGVIFAGVRYMFASADQKADLKSSLIHLVIGCVIVFATSTIISFIVKVFKNIVT